jgi:hypothetical protein
MEVRPHPWRAILILLVVAGTLCSQTASIGGHHSHGHVSHCCGVCHVGHLSLLQAVEHFGFIPPSLLCWHRPAEQPSAVLEAGLVLDLSRAPPA